MAATTQFAPTRAAVSRAASPLARWHLLSLDAPTVAVLWTWFIARANHIHLPPASAAAMAIAVWMLYAADRLLDARLLDARLLAAAPGGPLELEARHFFHHRHRSGFLAGIAAAAVSLAALLPGLNPAAIRLYLVEGVLLIAWFLILHATRSAHRLPKEIAVGLFFAAATFIPTISREPFAGDPALRVALLPSAILFAALCSLNCLFIYAWEHDRSRPAPSALPHPSTRLALAHLGSLTVAAVFAGVAMALLKPHALAHTTVHPPRAIAAACALSAALLLLLDRTRRRLPEITLRAAADLVLLTPLLLLPFLR